MSPSIFIEELQSTENTDELHSIIGRALIIATRFDSMCKAAALHMGMTREPFPLFDEAGRSFFLKYFTEKYPTLSSSIRYLGLPEDIHAALKNANMARNFVAHEAALGLTQQSIFYDEEVLIQELHSRISEIAYGDLLISCVVSVLSNMPLPNEIFLSSYVEKITNWVLQR